MFENFMIVFATGESFLFEHYEGFLSQNFAVFDQFMKLRFLP